jgi:two-component SAPR family response regulator
MDQAGQTFGRWWMFELSEKFLRKSEQFDPGSPNTLMSLAVTYHLSRKPEFTIDVLKRYLELDPSNHQALRMSIQSAGMVGDKAFADKVLNLMERHNPSALPLAKSYIENAFSN